MPHFYLDVHEGNRVLKDEAGTDLPGLEEAEREAAEAAAQIARDLLPNGQAREVKVDVCNEQKQRVLTVTISIQVERFGPRRA